MGNLSCHERSLASGFFSFWVSNAFSNTLTSVLTLVKMALSGVPIVDLERHSWVPQQETLTRVRCAFPDTQYTIHVLFTGTL
jgi:hypothetical protein